MFPGGYTVYCIKAFSTQLCGICGATFLVFWRTASDPFDKAIMVSDGK